MLFFRDGVRVFMKFMLLDSIMIEKLRVICLDYVKFGESSFSLFFDLFFFGFLVL